MEYGGLWKKASEEKHQKWLSLISYEPTWHRKVYGQWCSVPIYMLGCEGYYRIVCERHLGNRATMAFLSHCHDQDDEELSGP